MKSSGLCVSELVDLAYKIAKENFKDKDQFFSFSSIGSKVGKSAENFSKEKVENWIGSFYAELSTNPKFVVFAFNKGKLREYMTAGELKKLEKTIFSDDAVFEEEYEAYMKSVKDQQEIEIIPDSSSSDVEDLEEEQEEEEPKEKDEIFEEEE